MHTSTTAPDPFARSLAAGPPVPILDAMAALREAVAPMARPLAAGPPTAVLDAARACRLAAEERRARRPAEGR